MQTVHANTTQVVTRLKPASRMDGTNHLQLAISLPLRNQQELTAFLAQLQDPASPNYHKYLTPAQFTARFGPSQKDYNTLIAFARSHRLTVTARHPNRILLDVDGAVSDIEKALHVKMQLYQHPTEARQFYAPDADPTVNVRLAGLHISGLDNYSLPHPNYRIKTLNAKAAVTGNVGSGPGGTYSGYDFRAAYAPGAALTGAGQTVAVLEFDGYYASDIAYYENYTGLPNVPLTNVLLDGFNGTPSGDGAEVEVSLDIEVAIAMAPGLSKVIVYEAGPDGQWHDILNQIADDNAAKQISCSWYSPGGAADPVADEIFQQMQSQGQSFYQASGDYDAYTGLIPFPCDSPYITQVGGTTLTTPSAGGPYGSETAWNWGYDSSAGTYIGTGGGVSTQYEIPSWQKTISMTANLGSTTMRDVPDVAMTADNVYVHVDGLDYSVGGTSCAAPLWAGFTALINQEAVSNARTTVGFINPAVYAITSGTGYAAAFHDTTAGNNFSASSPTMFPAVTGYDLCTGCGTPTGLGLIYALAGPPAPIISTSGTLANGAVGAAYTQTLTAAGGVSPYTWSISAGALPAGLTLAPGSGVISGTPSASGTASFTVEVTGGNGDFSTAAFSVTIYPQGTPLIVTASPLPFGVLGQPYSQTFAATGGATPYAWSISSGSPPGGVTMSSAGVLSGTPATTGTFAFAVQVTGTDGLSSVSPFTLFVPPPPVITSASSATGIEGEPFGYQIIATNSPTSYNATGLPAGLSVSTSTGLISGTPTATGTAIATISAANGGGATSAALTITVLPGPPVITSALTVTATSGVPFSYQISATNGPASFGASALDAPGGAAVVGSDIFVVTQGNNSIGEYSATTGAAINNSFITALGHPVDVVLEGGNLFVTNQYSYTVGEYSAATGALINASFITGASLCNGIVFSANGTSYVSEDGYGTVGEYAANGSAINTSFISGLSGPAQVALSGSNLFIAHSTDGTIGEYNASTGAAINANFITGLNVPDGVAILGNTLYVANIGSNTVGAYNATTGATINANFIATGLNSPNYLALSGDNLLVTNYTTTGWVGEYDTASGNAIAPYFITGLPEGLTFNAATGVISGTPTTVGVTTATITAASASGTGSAALTITVVAGPPVITSGSSATATTGVPFSYQISANNSPTSFAASGLPAGLSVNTVTGVISGTATTTGTSNVAISAIGTGGTASGTLTLSVVLGPPQITSAASAEGVIGQPFSYQITATNSPTGYGASGLPAGLSVNSSSGIISGTPTSLGTVNGAISATNGAGTANAALAITVVSGPPGITSPLGAQATLGQPFNYQITATNSPTSFTASGLPAGLSVNTTTGLISGTPTTAGTSNAGITATNVVGSGTATLVITVVPPAPVITSTLTATGFQGAAFSYQITATNNPASYNATGLPAGLGVSPSTGVISGTPTSTGTASVTISASNAGGTGSATLTITVLSGPPVITSSLSVSATIGVPFSYQIAATNGPSGYGDTGLNGPGGTAVFGNDIFVVVQGNNAIGEYSATTGAAINPNYITGLGHPVDVVLTGTNLFVTNQYSYTVSEYSAATGALINASFITGASLCNGIAFAANGTSYVSLDGNGSVGEYAANGSTINADFISGLSGPAQVALSGSNLFVAHSVNGTIGEYNATTGAAVNASFVTGLNEPDGIAILGNTLYVANIGSNTVGEYDATTGAAINANFIANGLNSPNYLSLSGSTLLVTNYTTGGWVGEYNATTGAPINPYFFGSLPAGLSLNTATGVISGTPTSTGTSNIIINAINASGTGSANLTIVVASPAPVITSGSSALATTGTPFSYQITATNNPTSYGASGLPAGLSVNPVTGLISGTAAAAGTSNVIISAANSSGTGSATLTIAVMLGAPQITSAASVDAIIGQPFSYQIAATNAPANYGASNLPVGLALNAATGLISGTPTAVGAATGTISASNAAGTGVATLTITVVTGPPAITSALGAQMIVGQLFGYQITATNAPMSFGASGLPAGFSVNTATGMISGSASSTGTSDITISASNVGGSGTATLVLTVLPPAPVITSPLSVTGSSGVAFSYQIIASNNPASYNAAGLPAGLTVSPSTGIISGTPISTGTTGAVISASNAGGTESAILTITVLPGPPVITSALSVTATNGMPFSYQIVASNSPSGYGSSGLYGPAGTAISGSNFYVVIDGDNQVCECNAATGAATNFNFITGLGHPVDIVSTGTALFVTNQYSYTVGEYNAATGATINGSFISGASLCNSVVFSGSGIAYVSQDGYGSVGEYAANGSAINVNFITGMSGPGQMALSGTTLYVAHSSNGTVGEYNSVTGAAINASFITGLNGPNGLFVSGSTLYVSNIGGNNVGEYNANTGAAINANFITGLSSPNYLTVSGDNIFVTNYVVSGWVGEYNAATGAPVNPYFFGTLPPGLSLNSATGVISGTVTATGTCNFIISATNLNGTGIANLTINVLPAAPAITSAASATGTDGAAFTYQIAASNNPTSFGASGLPAGLIVNPVTGLISGTAMSIGATTVTISGSNAGGVGSAPLSLTMQSSFALWQSQWFTPAQLANPAISGNSAEPAGDGVPNLLKYAFNLDPLINGIAYLPATSVAAIGGNHYLTLTYTQDMFASGITYVPQVSSDLVHWFSGAGYVAPVSATPNGDGVTETVVVQCVTPMGATPQFIRLQVTSP